MPASQRRAIQNYRARLDAKGLARFEVLGRAQDRELIRSLARRLAEEGPEAAELRGAVQRMVMGEPPQRGGILAALRRSPLVGADLDLARPHLEGRSVEL
jgi:transposase